MGATAGYAWIAADLKGYRWDAGRVNAHDAGEAMEEVGRLLASLAAGCHAVWRVTLRDPAMNFVCRFTVRS